MSDRTLRIIRIVVLAVGVFLAGWAVGMNEMAGVCLGGPEKISRDTIELRKGQA